MVIQTLLTGLFFIILGVIVIVYTCYKIYSNEDILFQESETNSY